MIGTCLYTIFIYPLQLLFETVFDIFYSIGGNPGVSILCVSLVVNFLALPLYRRADYYAMEERKKKAELRPWTDHIKKTFRGDERYMMTNAYYKEQGYHPFFALRGSLSLLLQVPFFTAAYRFLSRLSILKGTGFLFLRDLGAEDALLVIGGTAVNVLPILMTVINLISGEIYSRGLPFRQKLSIYVLAAIFLVLLYHSPSGLVFYWTLNNLFSLGKNIVLRLIPIKKPEEELSDRAAGNWAAKLFFASQTVLAVFSGLALPAMVISSDPVSFADAHRYVDPNRNLALTLSLAVGVFLFWGGVIFLLLKRKHRERAALLSLGFLTVSLINALLFPAAFGTLSSSMVFEGEVAFGAPEIIGSLLFAVIVFAVLFVFGKQLKKHLKRILPAGLMILSASFFILGAVRIVRTEQVLAREGYHRNETEALPEKPLKLSRNGKNVVVIMLDRAIDSFVPYLFAEKKELRDSFTGFTWYPNTLSYGGHTNFGAPPLFGGYEYTPKRMNERSAETLRDKHDEALLVLPTLFSEEGMNVTVVDPPYAGYRENPDLSIYEGLENVSAYSLCGAYETEESEKIRASWKERRVRELFCYSLFRLSPNLLRMPLYDEGNYHDPENYPYVDPVLVNYYPVLERLNRLTEIEEGDEGALLLFQNGTTHAPSHLQLPGYTLALRANNEGIDTSKRVGLDGAVLNTENGRRERHYEVNMMAFLALSDWLQMLKAEGLYDNTRIILVADHGYDIGILSEIEAGDKTYDTTFLNPLLMVKDFGATGELKVSEEFMTNADVPSMAAAGVLDKALNPFTGNPLDNQAKEEPQIVTTSKRFWITDRKTFDTHDGHWFSVSDDIFDPSSWKDLGEGED
ncbi:MAG: membrane protein insertase YidC [Lachnospiraceae bacterium]|nr:membrane protein insertase YidC [Lachnospiraceae bacterium]